MTDRKKLPDHIKIKKKHDNLCKLVFDILDTQGLNPQLSVEYEKKDRIIGEMDVFCRGVYYECKCNYNKKQYKKGKEQIYRAEENNQCHTGYVVTYEGLYHIF